MDLISGIGVAGSILTAVGFGFTVQQLQRTAKATEAVNNAIGSLKNRMSAFDYASECVRAGRSLQHAIHLLKLHQWGDAATTILEVQTALFRISKSPERKAEGRAAASEMSTYLLDIAAKLEEVDDKQTAFDASDVLMTLRKQINLLDAEIIGINLEMYENA